MGDLYVLQKMQTLADLVNNEEPGIDLVKLWLSEGTIPYEILPASSARGDRLVETQVSTRSPMGAIVYDTGGILIDNGWLRILGSGSDRMMRSLPEWNAEILGDDRSAYLVADDALGGFFAINGGAFGKDLGMLYYLPYDDLAWEPLEIGYSEFISWCVTDQLYGFYGGDRFTDWDERGKAISADQCYCFYPFLWTNEGSVSRSEAKPTPAGEALLIKLQMDKTNWENKR